MDSFQQPYTSEQSRWEAYQFSDPFATNSFFCCNKNQKVVCRPNCDSLPKVAVKDDVEFDTDLSNCLDSGYKLCPHCDASDPNTQLDLALIKLTIDSINHSIGFTNDIDNKRRAYSVPSVATRRLSTAHGERQIPRNESEHIKLVVLACRHIASAASSYKKDETETVKGSKKKRRGGVLGFKELASKSKLSPWHFHRVFKSITGLTPKSYGDQCWKFIKDRERPQFNSKRGHFRPNHEITSNFREAPGRKKRTESDAVAPSLRIKTPPVPGVNNAILSQQVSPFTTEDVNKFQPTPIPNIYQAHSMNSNKNSLDINLNIAPFRHHSLDLGNMMDISDFNSSMINHLSPPYLAGLNQFTPQFNQNSGTPSLSPNSSQQQLNQIVPVDSNSYVHPHVIPQPNFQPVVDQFYTYSSNDIEQTMLRPNDMETSISQIDESQWPNVQASTPEEVTSKLLTPPSSASDSELVSKFKTVEDEVVSVNAYNNYTVTDTNQNNDQPFYDVIRDSPWENIEEGDIQQNFGLISTEVNDNLIDIYQV